MGTFQATYVRVVGNDLEVDALELGQRLNLGDAKRLVRLTEAHEILHWPDLPVQPYGITGVDYGIVAACTERLLQSRSGCGAAALGKHVV